MWMRDKEGLARFTAGQVVAKTSHTLNPVPFAIWDSRVRQPWKFRADGVEAGLTHVAATLINLLGYEAPDHMDPTLILPA
jgi:2,3-bisphosphoglycerate-independent phosphoglycerate mutase